MGRGSPRPLPGPSHLSISGFALVSGLAPNSRALRAPIRALPSVLGRFRPSIKASPSILGRNLGRFAPTVWASIALNLPPPKFSGVISGASRPRFGLQLPSIYPLRNFDLVAPLGEGFGRKHRTDKWNWNGYYFHTGTRFFPIRALGIIMPTVVEPRTRLQPSIKLHAPNRAIMFSCFGTQCLTPEGWRLR